MKLTPTTKEDFKEVETIQGIRERIQRYTNYNPLAAQILNISRQNNLTSQEAMVLLAYHALMHIESLSETINTIEKRLLNGIDISPTIKPLTEQFIPVPSSDYSVDITRTSQKPSDSTE